MGGIRIRTIWYRSTENQSNDSGMVKFSMTSPQLFFMGLFPIMPASLYQMTALPSGNVALTVSAAARTAAGSKQFQTSSSPRLKPRRTPLSTSGLAYGFAAIMQQEGGIDVSITGDMCRGQRISLAEQCESKVSCAKRPHATPPRKIRTCSARASQLAW